MDFDTEYSRTQEPTHPYWVNFVAGGTALATSFAVMHPLDTYKTLVQSRTRVGKITLQRLGKGLIPSTLPAFPQGGLRLATYELLSQHNVPSVLSVIAADLASSVVKVPRELVTARLQTSFNQTVWSVTRNIIKNEGVLALFKGFWTTSARDWPFMIILFTTYEKFNHFHSRMDFDSTLYPVIYGGISGGLAAFVTTPFDVLRTRIMTGSENLSTLKLVTQISKEGKGRIRPFFAGAASRTVWWFSVCSMFFPMYEYLQNNL